MTEERGERVDLGRWARRVLTWDAAMPVVVGVAPLVVGWAFPGRRGAVELLAVVLPIAALFWRAREGGGLILGNACSGRTRGLQFLLLFLGLFVMLFAECVVMLSALMPAEAVAEIWVVLGPALGFYFLTTVAAMYPGKTAPPREGADGDGDEFGLGPADHE